MPMLKSRLFMNVASISDVENFMNSAGCIWNEPILIHDNEPLVSFAMNMVKMPIIMVAIYIIHERFRYVCFLKQSNMAPATSEIPIHIACLPVRSPRSRNSR